ncbi:MAG: 1,6-anhydro-N-acetylmuramyl-L-alanine amidase AmpD [Pseudomonadota bacterium]|nr:1,6-anhydro-N-acetylmuramyl-L-alanine amidase AmpD [Pseudomonadota bacterium]
MDIIDGWLQQATISPSPNFDIRPDEADINLLVIHNISLPPGEYGGRWIDDLFHNCLDAAAHPYFEEIASMKVSAHCLIRRDGEVVQYVSFDQRAWHAGDSCFNEQQNCNDFSIGIELEGTDETPYTEAQYLVLVQVSKALMQYYPGITSERIAGHNDIAPGRKTDPGPAFDWSGYLKLLA